jgi:hypothetical protein
MDQRATCRRVEALRMAIVAVDRGWDYVNGSHALVPEVLGEAIIGRGVVPQRGMTNVFAGRTGLVGTEERIVALRAERAPHAELIARELAGGTLDDRLAQIQRDLLAAKADDSVVLSEDARREQWRARQVLLATERKLHVAVAKTAKLDTALFEKESWRDHLRAVRATFEKELAKLKPEAGHLVKVSA